MNRRFVMGRLTAERYEELASAILDRAYRQFADIAKDFNVSREYVRQVNRKLGLPGAQAGIKSKREERSKKQQEIKSNCIERLKESYPSEWNAYKNAQQRCNNPKNPNYKHYGGRGISFLFYNFREFMEHIKPKPQIDLSLDRIENNGNYEVGNVMWSTQKKQCESGRRRHNPRKSKMSTQKLALPVSS
jgi:membrane-associated HD superfamily phosphohydrolase